MIVVDLGMFYLYDRLGEAYQDKMQQRLLKEHMMVYQEQMHIMQQDQKKLDSLRHDMKTICIFCRHILMKEGMIRHRNM